jgi:hypothetical protein
MDSVTGEGILGGSQNTGGTVEAVHPVFRWDVTSGAAGDFIGRQPVTVF